MDNAQVGISIGLAVKGLSRISELKKGFDGLKSKIAEAKKAITSLDNTRLSNLSSQIRESQKALLGELTTNFSNLTNSVAIGVPIKLAIDDEAAFANVKKYVDDSDENLAKLKNEMRGLSSQLGESFSNIADIAAGGGKINLAGEELVTYTKMLATGSVAFEMSSEALSKAANNMKVGFKMNDIKELNSFFDSVNLLDNKVTNANASDIFEATSLTAANASLIGLDSKSASAISATMLSTGKASSVVGTSLNALYSALSMADKKGKNFQEALASIGMDATYLKTALQKDAAGAITSFLEAISRADKDKQAGLLYDLVGGNFNDEIAGLVTNIDALKANIKMAHSDEATGSMQRELQTKLNTTKSGIERVTQAWRNLGSSLGETFLPLTNLLASILSKVAGVLSSLNEKFPRLSAIVVSAAAGLMIFKPVLLLSKIALLGVADGLLGVIRVVKFLNPMLLIAKVRWLAHAVSISSATIAAKAHALSIWLVGARLRATLAITTAYSAASKAFGVACGVMRSGLMAVTLATKAMKFALISTGIGAIVVALGMAAAYLIENWDEVKAFFLEIWESVKPYWQSTTKFFSDLWQGVSDFLSAIFEPVIKIWDELFGGFFDWIAEKFGWINDMVGEAIKGLSSAWSKTKEFFGFGDDEQVSSELKPKDDSGGFFNSIFGSDSDTHAKEAPALVAASTGGGAINISFNGDFLLNSDNGKFDLESFKAQIVKGVKDALRRDEFNRKNTDVRG